MRAISPVLPASPQFVETVLAKNQPQYKQLPVANVEYSDGTISMISRYSLTWRERITLLFSGCLWLEQLTFGNLLQPQRPTVYEPLTTTDHEQPASRMTITEGWVRAKNAWREVYRSKAEV